MRSPKTKTLVIGIVALVLACVSLAITISNVVVKRQPELALKVWPGNGHALSRIADRVFNEARQAEQTPELAQQAHDLKKEARQIAERSLTKEPLNPAAFRIIAEAPDQSPKSRRQLLQSASALTRRDSLLQIAIIETVAREGDGEAALEHYDALLRRRTAFRDAAGRGLAKALAAPDLVKPMGSLLRRSPPWESLLFHYLLQEPSSWDGFIALHRDLQGRNIIPVKTSADFTSQLIDAGRIDDAITISRLVNGPVIETGSKIIETKFMVAPPFPGNWATPDNAAASLIPLREGGALLSLSRGASGTIARKLIALTSGQYQSSITINKEDSLTSDAKPPQLQARLACADQTGPARFSNISLVVDQSCKYQWLSIFLEESSPFDSDIIISQIRVKISE